MRNSQEARGQLTLTVNKFLIISTVSHELLIMPEWHLRMASLVSGFAAAEVIKFLEFVRTNSISFHNKLSGFRVSFVVQLSVN